MANPSDVSIPTPMASGATDHPDAPQPSGEPQAPPTPAGFSDTPQQPQPPPVPAGFSDKPPVETPGHGASSTWTPPQKMTTKKTTPADISKHGLLSRAWDWVNQPIFDNVLPEGVKTADIIKAAAFEGMYHQAYIPGVNDFDTMAEQHFGGAKGEKPTDSQTKAAIRAFINGVGKDTADMAAGFTSPLAVGTMGLGSEEVQGAAAAAKLARVAKFAKYGSRFAGTAFGAQGLYQAGHGVKGMLNGGVTPENLQETLGGLGQATLAGAGEAHVAGRALEDSVRPVMKTIHGQDVPVRPKGLVPETIAKTVEPSVIDAATRKTEAAVQTGVGNVAGEAVGSNATTDVGTKDRFGLRGHAEDLIENQSRPIMQKLDQLSDRAFSDAQKEAKKYARDFTGDGREKFQAALDAQDRIIEEHRPLLESQGYDVDAMRDNYRKGIAVQKIATAFDAATGPREGGGYEIDGEKLAKTIDRLRRAPEDKNLFDKAGMTDTHVNALGDLADTLRKEQVTPKFGGLTKLAAKAIAFMIPSSGIRGIAEALTGEAMAEKFGSKVMTRLVGEAMTSEPSARQLTAALQQGPQALSGWDKFKSIVKSLWDDETGTAAAPGKVPLTAEDKVAAPKDEEAERLKQIAQPKRDTDLMGQARQKLGPDASISAVAQEAARMAKAAREVPEVQQSAAAAPAVEPMAKPESEIGTRYPKDKNATGENNPDHMPDMAAMEQAEKHTPGYFDKLIESMKGYPGDNGLPLEDLEGKGSRSVVENVINHLADNLTWLHDNTPGYIRGISKQWYDTAHKMTKMMADKYGISHEKMAAVTAALSPKNGWDNNVGMADRLVNIWKNSREHAWDSDMEKKLNEITGRPKLKDKYRSMLNSIRGQKFDELTAKSPEALLAKKGLWIRIFDEAHNGKQTPVYAPDGTIRAHRTLTWGMPDPMAKAIAVLEGPDTTAHINDMMGDKNKIRSFYNNIISPDSPRGHVTVDTHAVNADMLKPLGSDDDEVWHNFSGAPGHAETGLAGTYAVHAEAYRRAAAKLGLKPRELQSITWEAIRTLMGEDKKTPELKAKINEIWSRYKGRAADPGVSAPGGDFEARPTAEVKKTLTIDQVRDAIVKASGGFDRPQWAPETKPTNPNEAVGDKLQQPMHQTPTTETPAFKSWFGDSKVTDEQGEPKVVYHGTTHEFNEFTPERGNVENHFGKGYYFTDEPGDANRNYVGEAESGTSGPDLTNRIDQRVEELRNEIPEEPEYGTPEYHEMMERLTEEAKAELQGQSPHIKPTYLKMENPVVVQPDGGTRFELQVDDDGNESGSALKLYDAVRDVADEWEGDSTPVNGQQVWGDIMSKLPDGGYDFNAHEFAEAASTALADHEISVDGKFASGEFVRRVFEKAGFDGIDQDAHADFGHMGVNPGTRHYIVFDPRNIKSATGNAGTFDPSSPDIQQQSVTLGQGPTTMNVDATPAVSPELLEKWQGKPQPALKRTPSGRPDWSGKYGPGLQDIADYLNANVTPEHMTFAAAHEVAHAFVQHHVGTGTDGMEIVLGNKAMRRGRKVGSGNAKSTSDGVAGGYVAPGESWFKRQQELGGEPEKIQSFLRDYTMQLMAGKAMEEILGQPGHIAASHAKNDIAMSRKMLGLFNVPAYLHDTLIHTATRAAKEVLQQNFDTLHHLTRQAVKHYGKHSIDAETFHHYREGGEFQEPDEK